MTRALYLKIGSMAGLSGKETMLELPGIIYDIANTNKTKKR